MPACQSLGHERITTADVEDGVSGAKRHVPANQIVSKRQPRPLPRMAYHYGGRTRVGFNEIHAFRDQPAPAASLRCCRRGRDRGEEERTRTLKSLAARDLP